MKPIAAPIVGGMITSTIHVLILVPVFFALMKERALRSGALSTKPCCRIEPGFPLSLRATCIKIQDLGQSNESIRCGNGMLQNCLFGTYRAVATNPYCLFSGS